MTTPRRQAFTLIELLLATGMVAMLMLSLYVGVSAAMRARIGVDEQTNAMRQARITLDLIEQDLKSVLPPAGTLAGAFTGSPGGGGDAPSSTLDCYSISSDFGKTDTPTGEGMRHVNLYLLGDADNTLERDVTRNPLSTTPQIDAEILARNVVGFGVTYYDGTNWTDTWDSASQNTVLPIAADVTVVIKAPMRSDPNHTYRASRLIPLPCGRTVDQATADLTTATNLAAGGIDTGIDPTATGNQ